jgi:2-polyprenyl-3-methyl-5-hydroxy-6-metoxy-1,4-benzoquinol methylase
VYRPFSKRREEARLAWQRFRTDFKNRRAITVPNITRRNNRRAYERVYTDDRLMSEYLTSGRVDFYREVAEFCSLLRPQSVIDVGCGTGNLLHAIVKAVAPKRVVGVDYTRAGVMRARQLIPSGEFESRDIYTLECTDVFELVLCTEVLEHLADPDAAMQVLTRLCSSAGTIVITVPDGAEDTWEGHRNFWTESELEAFMRRYGCVEVLRMRRAERSLLAVVRPLRAQHESAPDDTSHASRL